MIGLTVTSKREGLARAINWLDRRPGFLAVRGATEYPRFLRRRILEGRRPDGSRQKRNAESTIRRKGHSTALLGLTKTLSNPNKWSVRPAGRNGATAEPPDGYVKIIERLEKQDYGIIGPGEEYLSWLERLVGEDYRVRVEV